MRGVKIYLSDGTYRGTVTMSSDSSKIAAIRVEKEKIQDYENELDGPGIYLLLSDTNSVYVGQTGLDTIKKRIMNTHSGDIDATWHTVFAFKFPNATIGTNELLFIENALCEYVHEHFRCLTTTPTRQNCNKRYRKQHYHLESVQIHTCENYIEDIEFYISIIPESIFPEAKIGGKSSLAVKQVKILHLAGKKVSATGYID